MPAYNFQERFAPDVESGRKQQTIRPRRKRPTRAGDTLYLYAGMRTKRCRKLREAICKSVSNITIWPGWVITLNGRDLSRIEANELARADGFSGIGGLYDFFRGHYKLPFEGELITW